MSTQCQSCTAPTDLFLCSRCIADLRTTLADLPQWLEWLEDAAFGRTCMGGSSRGSSRREPFKGDDHALTRCRCGHPEHELIGCRVVDVEMVEVLTGLDEEGNETTELVRNERRCACDDYRPTIAQSKLRARLFAMGRVNVRASDKIDEIRNTVTTWTRHIAESRGVVFVRVGFIGPLRPGHVRLTMWDTRSVIAYLRAHVQAIACDEAAGELYRDFAAHQRAIERIVNRPVPQRFAGPCPAMVTDKVTHRQRECGTRLMAPREASRVRCPECKAEHDIERIIMHLLANVEHWRFTREELIGSRTGDWEGIMGLLDESVSKSTFHRWCKDGSLKPNGYRRPDGSNGISRHTEKDQPLYRLVKVRQLRSEMGSKQAAAMGWAQ